VTATATCHRPNRICPGSSPVDADSNLTTTYTYDDAGRMVAMTVPDPSATSGGSAATVTTRYAYDAVGRLCRVLENASVDLASLPDPCTTTVSGTASANTSTRYTYDAAGNLASMTDASGHSTTYGYDAAGRMTNRTDALGGQLIWRYDEVGNRTSQRNRTDPVPTNSLQWAYDAAGRMTSRTANGVTTTYTYDAGGNKLTATTGTMTITATYDRLNRVLTVDDDDADTTPDTRYTYSLTSPSWTDPTGSYSATLDAFDRPVAMTDPVSASTWSWTYGAAGQVKDATQGNGNMVASTFDATGRELTRTTADNGTTRAAYEWAYNRAGLVLTEDSQVTGDPSNGTTAYGYDPLGRLTSSGSTGYTWDAATNRTGSGSSTTAFDAANRPTSGTSPTASYQSDADGQLTARPGQTMAWDHLGRLLSVTTASGTTTYTYDPLDRLRTVTDPGGTVTRFRYTGLTTSAAQLLDGAGTVTRDIGNGPTGERLLDWVPGSPATDRRYHGTNAHHDTTWLADATGAVLSSLRYDPWGVPRSPVPTGFTPFRFQGSWHDTSTDLAWVVTRWYAPSLGTFLSEDSLLGEPRDPDSRHLYAYGAGEPVGAWDPDGRVARRPNWDPYALYRKILRYMTEEMRHNARGHEFGFWRPIRSPIDIAHDFGVLVEFGLKVNGEVDLADTCKAGLRWLDDRIRPPLSTRAWLKCPSNPRFRAGPWDHKPKLKTIAKVPQDESFWTPIPGTGRKERIRFDIWSNIHYGYVGLSHGIPVGILAAAQSNGKPADDLSVGLGFLLWKVHGPALSEHNLHSWIVRAMGIYRQIPKVVKAGW
jgi:RHS repeat-associated protein